jgi:hypothetical protein
MATADNGELMALSGFINPYPGKLGVVEEGALADLLLVDGNPLENIKLIADPDKNFLAIMKAGTIYKIPCRSSRSAFRSRGSRLAECATVSPPDPERTIEADKRHRGR